MERAYIFWGKEMLGLDNGKCTQCRQHTKMIDLKGFNRVALWNSIAMTDL